MFNDIPSDDGDLQIEQQPSNQDQQDAPKEIIRTGWDQFWQRITSLGMGDIALRAGTALITVGLIGLVVWVMKGNFVSEDLSGNNNDAFVDAGGGSEISVLELPAYEGVAPVEGITKSADTHTDAPTGSRYDFQQYTVVTGDTIFGISQTFGVTAETLLWTNYNLLRDNPAAIYPGQVLTIPPVDGVLYTWNAGDGLNGVSNGLNVTPETIIEWPGNGISYETIGDYANPNIEPGTAIFAPGGSRFFFDWTTSILARDEPAESAIWGEGKCAPTSIGPIGTGVFIWPAVQTYLSGYDFSPEINHWGIDVAGDLNDPLYAVDNGVIVYAGWSDWGYGNVVAIDHGNGYQSLYGHLQSLNVGCGSFVTKGDIIGYMGSTGNSSGPHLHFELIGGNYGRLNPHNYLPY
ncbi:MAG: peptidoglycan DD-metalloendopeptidase family protein [Pelolinea sp.]|nr:peptidoglycan DD-metalloendopeptidase family protein [Pelolinea sp.]